MHGRQQLFYLLSISRVTHTQQQVYVCACVYVMYVCSSDTHWKQNSTRRLEILLGRQKKEQADNTTHTSLSCLHSLSSHVRAFTHSPLRTH